MIQFDVGFKVNAKSLEGQLSTISKEIDKAFEVTPSSVGMGRELSQAVIQARTLQDVLQKASTTKGLSFIGMNAELRKAGTTSAKLVTDLMAGGQYFQGTTNQALVAFSSANRQAVLLNKRIAEMGRVFMQSFKFTAAQMAIQSFQSSIQQTVQWVIRLDKELNSIQVVSGKTAEQMGSVSAEIVERSRALRVAALDYAQASQIYYQQGLQDDEVIRRADITIKAAQAANENVKNMSNMLTAVWNTYNMQGEQLERAASIGAMLGADTAIEFRDIAEAMQISASAASQMGVSYESLASIIATVGSTTRQSASIIGNAFKTIFARFQQLESTGTDGEVGLGQISQDLEDIGVKILDPMGELMSLDSIIMQTGQTWDTYSQKQQLAIAQLVGGTRQYGQFLALMENFDDYVANLNKSNAQTDGSVLEDQYNTTIDSLESRIMNVSEAWKRAFSNLYEEDGVKGLLSGIEDIGNLVGSIIQNLGGLPGILGIVGTFLISKIPKALSNISGYVRDINDSLNPTRAINRIISDADKMKADNVTRDATRMPVVAEGSTATPAQLQEIAAINLVTEANNQKIEVAKQAAIAQERLNRVIQNGNSVQQVQASALKAEITKRQENLYAINDEIDALRRKISAQNDLYQAGNEATRGIADISQLGINANGKEGTRWTAPRREEATNAALGAEKQFSNLGFNEAAESIETLRIKLAAGEISIKDFKQQYEGTVKSVAIQSKAMAKAITGLGQNFKTTFSSLDTEEGLQKTKTQLKELAVQIEALESSNTGIGFFTPAQLENIKTVKSNIESLANETSPDIIAEKIANIGAALNNLASSDNKNSTLQGMANNLANLGTKLDSATNSTLRLGESQEQAKVMANGLTQSTTDMTQSLARMGSGLLMSLRGFDGLFQAIKSGNASFGQLIMMTGLLFSGLRSAATAIGAMKVSQNGLTVAEQLGTVAASGQAAAHGVLGTVSVLASAGIKTMSKAVKEFFKTLGPIYLVILAVTAALYALFQIGKTVVRMVKDSTAEAGLERQRKAAEGLKTAAEEANTAAQELKSTFDSYGSAKDALDECTQGTQEWKEQLRETNMAALEVINSLDALGNTEIDLRGLYTRENGEVIIDPDKMQEIQTTVSNQASQAQFQASMATLMADSTALQMQAQDMAYSLGLYGKSTDNFDDDGNYLGTEFTQGYDILLENADHLLTLSTEEFGKAVEELNGGFYVAEKDLEGVQDKLRSFMTSTDNLAEKQNAASDLIVQDMLGNSYSDIVKDMVAQNIDADILNQKRSEIYKPTDARDKFGIFGAGKINDFVDDYNEIMGTNYRASGNFARENDEDGLTYAFIDKVTNKLVEINREEVITSMATQQALNELTGSAESAAEVLNSIEVSDTGIEEYFSSNNFNSLTQGELEKNFQDENGDISQEKIQQYLQKVFGWTEAEYETEVAATAEKLGKTTDEFIAEITHGVENSFSALDGVGRSMSRRARKIFNEVNTDSLNVNEQNTASDIMQDVFANFGKEGAEGLKDIFNSVSKKDLPDFVNELNNIDWATITPDELNEHLKEAGISTKKFSDELPLLIRLMQRAAEVTLVDAQNTYKETIENLGGLDLGSSIDKEIFKGLGEDLQEFFTLMADGTYMLTGNVREFKKEVDSLATSGYRDLLREYERNIADLTRMRDNFKIENFDSLDNSGYDRPAFETYLQSDDFSLFPERDYLGLTKVTNMPDLNNFVDFDIIAKQLDALRSVGNIDAAQLNDWESGLEDQNLNAREIEAIFEEYRKLEEEVDKIDDRINENIEAQQKLLDTLQAQRVANDLAEAGIDYSGLDGMRVAILATIEAEKDLDDEAKTYHSSLKDNDMLLTEVAKEQLRFNQAIDTGTDNMEDWTKLFEKGTIKDMKGFSESVGDIRNAYADLLDVDASVIDDSFLSNAENMELFGKVINGTVEEATAALDDLQKNMVLSMDLELPTGEISTYFDTIREYVRSFDGGEFMGTFEGLDSDFKSALQSMITAAGDDVALIEAIFNAVEIEPIPVEEMIPHVGTNIEEEVATTTTNDTNEAIGMEVVQGDPEILEAVMTGTGLPGGVAEGETSMATMSIPQWTFAPVPTTEVATKENTIVGYEISPDTKLERTSSNKNKVKNAGPSRGGGGKKGGGGGGGGGKKSNYKKPAKKPRYVNNTNRQKATANSMEKIGAVEEKLYGRSKLAAMEKKNKLIAEQAQDYQRLYKEAQAYLAQDKNDLATTRLGQTMPVQYDNQGNILNQEEIDNWMIDWKEALDKIEDETQKEAEQIAYDLSEIAWENLKDSREQMINFLKEGVSQLQDWIEQQIATANYQYEIDVKVNERDIRLLEYTLNKLGESGLMSGDGLTNLQSQVERYLSISQSGVETAEKLIQLYDSMKTGNINNQLGSELFGGDVWAAAIENGSLTATILDAIGENTEDLIGYAESLAEAYVEAWNQVSAALQAYMEEFDSLTAKMENASSLLDTWVSIWEESGEKYKDNSTYLRLLQTRLDAVGNSVETTRDKYMALQEAEDAARETWEIHKDMFEEGEITGQQWDAINAVYKEARDAMLDAQADYYSSVQDYIAAIKEYEEQAAQQIVYTWDQALSNLWADVSDSMTGYDMITQIQEFFLADFEKDYHLDTLLRQTSDAMGELTDPGRLAEYQKFLDEINEKQAEGVKLTQTDVDIMNARFKLMQAQDAYEEAQNSKNTMRLSRDASGNYAYVYSGDDTSGAEQDLADAAYELQKLTEEAAKQAASSWYETWLAYQNYVKEIDQTRYNSDEKYAQQVDYMRQMYETQLVQLKDKVIEYNEMAGFTFSETALGLMTQSDNMQHTQETYVDAVGDLFTELNDMYAEYDEKIRDTASKFENANGDMKESAEDAMSAVRDQMAETARETSNLADSMADNWTTMIRDVSDWSLATIDQINAVIAKLEEYYARQTEVMRHDDGGMASGPYKWMQDDSGWWFGDGQGGFMQGGWFQDDKGDWYYANSDGYIEQAQPNSTTWVGGYEIDSSGKWTGNMKDDHTVGSWKEANDTKPNKGGTYDDYANGTAGNGSGSGPGSGSSDGDFSNSEDDAWQGGNGSPWWYGNGERALYSGWKKINGRWYQFDSNGYLVGNENGYDQKGSGGNAKWQGYAMGGFTGSTPNGGLAGIDQFPAMLAPGEYVLNPDDTHKILKAVKIVKNLSSLGLAKAADAISSLASSATNVNSNSETTPVQQEVHIDASFPGVSVASEIEEALSNIVNETVQYISGRNR